MKANFYETNELVNTEPYVTLFLNTLPEALALINYESNIAKSLLALKKYDKLQETIECIKTLEEFVKFISPEDEEPKEKVDDTAYRDW